MSDTRRREPYIWPSWVSGHISGERSCDWASWYKAHYQYAKTDDRGNNLSAWQADHAALVRYRLAQLADEGWEVTTEDQNKFAVQGKSGTTVGGKADIVAIRGDEALVEDCKTGRKKESDYWQVVVYMLMLPKYFEALADKALRGRVSYADGSHRDISPYDAERGREAVYERLRSAGGPDEPPRVPSFRECRYCDIAACPDRVTDSSDGTARTFESF